MPSELQGEIWSIKETADLNSFESSNLESGDSNDLGDQNSDQDVNDEQSEDDLNTISMKRIFYI